MEFIKLSYEQMEAQAHDAGLSLPIEQTKPWADLEQTIEGVRPWGVFRVEDDGVPRAFIALFNYETHGYHYLRAAHGPVWIGAPSEDEEHAFLVALHAFVKARDPKQVFVRLAVASDDALCRPTLSTLPYNQTVVMDLDEDEEVMLQGLKPRGRRDVRKALRESPATYADETARATESFEEYYEVLVETAHRDGFVPAEVQYYANMIRMLGPDHCRVFAGRVEGQVVTWTIATISGTQAHRYYGASRTGVPKRSFVTDGLIFFESCTLAKLGVKTYDMMGIGNDFAPSLKGLNTFKTKFSKAVSDIAPDRDLPLRTLIYGSLVKARKILRLEEKAAQKKDV